MKLKSILFYGEELKFLLRKMAEKNEADNEAITDFRLIQPFKGLNFADRLSLINKFLSVTSVFH